MGLKKTRLMLLPER